MFLGSGSPLRGAHYAHCSMSLLVVPQARQLLAEAQSGSRTRPIRIFFESADAALHCVAEENARLPREIKWHNTTNNLILPEGTFSLE